MPHGEVIAGAARTLASWKPVSSVGIRRHCSTEPASREFGPGEHLAGVGGTGVSDTVPPGKRPGSPLLGDGSAVLKFSTVRPGRTLISANAVPGRLQPGGTSTRQTSQVDGRALGRVTGHEVPHACRRPELSTLQCTPAASPIAGCAHRRANAPNICYARLEPMGPFKRYNQCSAICEEFSQAGIDA
jgi:hypothetical protein